MKIRKSNFINGILSLFISQILIKIFGIMYSIYMTNKSGFGDSGNAIYMSGYQIYALLLTVSSIGVPNAISKMISEKKAIKDSVNADRIFKISIFLFSIIGCIGSIILYIFSDFISIYILEIPETSLSLKVLAPAIFFVSINSAFKGYFNGINKIHITAKTQFYEQVYKSILTILLLEIFSRISNNNIEVMASVANFATTIATCFSLIYIMKKYKEENYTNNIEKNYYPKEDLKEIVKKVLVIAIPMTLNAILSSFGKNVDSVTIVKILKDIIGEENAIRKYGIISSKIDILISVPLAFNASISTALIPEIASLKNKNDIDGIVRKIEFSILITLMLGIPYAFGLFSYSNKIFALLFPNASEGDKLLKIAAFGVIFSMLTQTINAILQGLGKNKIPVYASFWGIILKVFFNIVLLPIEGIYEKGAIISNIISNFSSFIIVYFILIRNFDIKIKFLSLSTTPIFSSIIMIKFSLFINELLLKNKINNNFSTLISIGFAVLLYGTGLFVMKMLKNIINHQKLENTGFLKVKTLENLKNKEKFLKK